MMEEDDLDFTPISTTSSNLASLFGFNKEPAKGNPSLTYTAPKAPKKESSPMKTQPSTEKRKFIISKPVQAYKLENRAYVSQGLTGIAIFGNHDSHHYEIILYKPTKKQISETTFTRNFSITLSPNNYISFYDNNKQNWSIVFQSLGDLAQITRVVAMCKFFSKPEPPEDILIQDLTFSDNPQADMESTVEILYTSRSLNHEHVGHVIEFEIKGKIKLSNFNFTPLSKGLIGCHEGSTRVIMVPHSLSERYIQKLQDKNYHLLIEVKLEKIISTTEEKIIESTIFDDCQESSSAEESIIKARGASIKEALTATKSQKANLISRMARMGQATLPLKQSLTSGPSDSEEESSLSTSPKPRMSRNRVSGSMSLQNTSSSLPSAQSEAQQLAVYQNDLALQQSQLAKPGVTYQHRIAVSASPISSPTTDPSFSVYVSESRIQAAELRMGMCKISEKLDSVCNKLQNMSALGTENKTQQQALLDSSGILSSIQSLILENESLKGKVEEQKGKIEQQNDRIFQLLELNHKYLEQSSTSLDKQSENENKLKTEVQYLREKEGQLEADKEKVQERTRNLEESLAAAEETKRKLNERIEQLSEEVEKMKLNLEGNDGAREKEIQNWEAKISGASKTISTLNKKLKEVACENETLKSVIKNQRDEIAAGKEEMKEWVTKNERYEREVESLKKQIFSGGSESGTKIDDLSKVLEVLQEENKRLSLKLEKEIGDTCLKFANILKDKFSDSKDYPGSMILTVIYKCYKELTGGSMPNDKPLEGKETKSNTQTAEEKTAVLPAPRTSLQKPDVVNKEHEGTKSPESKNIHFSDCNKKEDLDKTEGGKTESDSRYKSYDQGWRTTKPPPPPLFDDDEDDDVVDWLN